MWTPRRGSDIQVQLWDEHGNAPISGVLDPNKEYELLVTGIERSDARHKYRLQSMTEEDFGNDKEDKYQFRSDGIDPEPENNARYRLTTTFKAGDLVPNEAKRVRIAFVPVYDENWTLPERQQAPGFGADVYYTIENRNND